MLKSLDTITGTTSTVSILSRTVRWHDDNYVDSGHFVANGKVARLSPTPDNFFNEAQITRQMQALCISAAEVSSTCGSNCKAVMF